MNVRSINRAAWPAVAVAVAVAVAAAGCRRAASSTERGVAVRVVAVEKSSGTTATRYSAQIVPATRVELAFKVGGYVETIAQVTGVDGQPRPLQEGDVVDAGTALATIRKTEYTQKIAEAKAGVAEAYTAYKQARLDFGRDAKLGRTDSLPQASVDTSRSRRDSAGAALAGARVRLAQATTALTDTTLTSPMSGVVVKRAIEVGSLAAPGTVAFAIADVTAVKAVFGVPDVFLSRIQLGAAQRVTTDALPGIELEGKVSRLAPSADQKSHVFEVDLTIPNLDGRLKAGMVVALSVDQSKLAAGDGLFVPLTAIVRAPDGKGFAVFAIEQKGSATFARARIVELGEYLGRVIPIRSGLVGDEQVVVQGAGLLSDGERVEVIP